MRKFSDLGIKPDNGKKIFDCRKISISDIINCEIEVLDFIPDVKTMHGDGRYIVSCKENGIESKFFSNSKAIKSVLDQVAKEDFPFTTTIKCTKCGNGKFYQFT